MLATVVGIVASVVVCLTALVGGIFWLVRKLMSLGVWLGAINSNTVAMRQLTEEVRGLREQMNDNTQRIEVLEGQRRAG